MRRIKVSPSQARAKAASEARRGSLHDVAVIAGGIVLEHGNKQTKWSKGARVPYATLDRLRVALEAAGYDMKTASKRFAATSQPPAGED